MFLPTAALLSPSSLGVGGLEHRMISNLQHASEAGLTIAKAITDASILEGEVGAYNPSNILTTTTLEL